MVAFSHFLAAAFSLATSTLALPTVNGTLSVGSPARLVCGSDSPPRVGLLGVDEASLDPSTVISAFATRTFNVYWNVIHKDNTYAGGYLSSAQIDSAIAALNSHYTGSDFTFQRSAVTYTQNADWFENLDNKNNTALTTAMKNQLHVGTAKDLNIYSVGFKNINLGGFATFPWRYTDAPKLDGVVFKWNTTPGGSFTSYNQGKILVHEVGHWVGLLHTFQGGCSDTVGDRVSDTPAEASEAYGCPVGRDSCPGLVGNDPIRNHMDYTNDACKTDPFTNGQIVRMQQMVQTYRAN